SVPSLDLFISLEVFNCIHELAEKFGFVFSPLSIFFGVQASSAGLFIKEKKKARPARTKNTKLKIYITLTARKMLK
ncbi:hypothetical protein, partial [Pedobacter jejuensis]